MKGWVPFSTYTGQDYYFTRKEDLMVVWPEIRWWLVNRKSNCNNCSKIGAFKIMLRVQYSNWIQINEEYVFISLGKKKLFCLILRSDTFFFLKTYDIGSFISTLRCTLRLGLSLLRLIVHIQEQIDGKQLYCSFHIHSSLIR